MTREEAIEELKSYAYASWGGLNEALEMALAALRPVSREQVERMKGVWIFNDDWWEFQCSKCHKGIGNIGKYKFCPHCGARMDKEDEHEVSE